MSFKGHIQGSCRSLGKVWITVLSGKAYQTLMFACGCMQLCRVCTAGHWAKQMAVEAIMESWSDAAKLLTEGK